MATLRIIVAGIFTQLLLPVLYSEKDTSSYMGAS